MTTDEQLLNDDIAARANALDATRSFIVQAPAGSGKTELLIQRYLNLLAFVEHPEEVIAITFTRKAAAEMHARVVSSLQGSSNPVTKFLADDVLRNDKKNHWRLLDNPQRMRIQTIDSLCARLTSLAPILSKFGAKLRGHTIKR